MTERTASSYIPEPKFSQLVFSDTRFAWLWFIVRAYVAWQWLSAGWEKLTSPAWIGPQAGTALHGFLVGAQSNAAGAHPSVSGWYAFFISNVALPNAALFSYLVAFGELAVGLGLILGAFTGIAAFFGAVMNFNYLFAGTLSTNPALLLLELFLILAWRNAGWLGMDRFLLPYLGVPWQKGRLFEKREYRDLSPMEILAIVMAVGLLAIIAITLMFG